MAKKLRSFLISYLEQQTTLLYNAGSFLHIFTFNEMRFYQSITLQFKVIPNNFVEFRTIVLHADHALPN